MTDTERKIFKLEGDIYVQNMHLKWETNHRSSLPINIDDRQKSIEQINERIRAKQAEIQQLVTRNSKPETRD